MSDVNKKDHVFGFTSKPEQKYFKFIIQYELHFCEYI